MELMEKMRKIKIDDVEKAMFDLIDDGGGFRMVVYRASVVKPLEKGYIVVRSAFGTTPAEAWENLEKLFPLPVDMPEVGEYEEDDEFIYTVEEATVHELIDKISEMIEYLNMLWNVFEDLEIEGLDDFDEFEEKNLNGGL